MIKDVISLYKNWENGFQVMNLKAIFLSTAFLSIVVATAASHFSVLYMRKSFSVNMAAA